MDNTFDTQAIAQQLATLAQIVPAASMPRLHQALAKAGGRLGEPMQLAIIGKISSSKSTLVNAILGRNEVMATGQMEVTYNVGWLRHGRPDHDIIIHHKDHKPPTSKSQKEFEQWSSKQGNSEMDNVSYIEVFDDAEILREVNIIDTPGLDATRGKDSQNTLDFIANVRPDAVIMLFTNSVSDNVLDVVRQFNAGTNFTPLNAIGVLAKTDVLWEQDLERSQTALKLGHKSINSLKRRSPQVKQTLFDLYPISALLFLASATLTDETLNSLRQLAQSDPAVLRKLLTSGKKFTQEEAAGVPSCALRHALWMQLGLYGVSLLTTALQKHTISNLAEARQLLRRESGADDFMRVLHNHFGLRARLIKLESIYQELRQAVKTERGRARDATAVHLLDTVDQRVGTVFASLVHEHREYDMLYRIYNGQLTLDDDTRSEFFTLCGEGTGDSAPERLGLPVGATTQQLLDRALERERHWRREMVLEPDPEERQWMDVMLTSYMRIRQKVQTMKYHYEQARAYLFNE